MIYNIGHCILQVAANVTSKKLPKNVFTRKIIDFDTFT